MSDGVESLALVKINQIIVALNIGVLPISQKWNEFTN
jgi:hypothetical protein